MILGSVEMSVNRTNNMYIESKISQDKEKWININCMVDSGATGNFISRTMVEAHGLISTKRYEPVLLTAFDRGKVRTITHQTKAVLKFNNIEQEITFDVVPMTTYQAVLGLPWLKTFNPTIDWQLEKIIVYENNIAIAETKAPEDWVKLIPEQLHDYLSVFSEEEAKELPPHRKE